MADGGAWAPHVPRRTRTVVTPGELQSIFQDLKSRRGPKSFCIPCYTEEKKGQHSRRLLALAPDAVKGHCSSVHAELVKPPRSVSCNLCGNPLPSKKDLMLHKYEVHSEPRYTEPCRFFGLFVWAALEELTDFSPSTCCDDPRFAYRFKIKCAKCGTTTDQTFKLRLGDVGPQGTVDLKNTCRVCDWCCLVQMIPGYGSPHELEMSRLNEMNLIMVFKCFGCEPVSFEFGPTWAAVSLHGTVFGFDATPRQFADYCDHGDVAVVIHDMASKFDKVELFLYADGTRSYLSVE